MRLRWHRAAALASLWALSLGACGGAETRGSAADAPPPACSEAYGALPGDVGQTPPPQPAEAGDVPPMRCGDDG